ncbi:MAG: peptidase MA family metallohydrolase [Acidobacteriota bacterium]
MQALIPALCLVALSLLAGPGPLAAAYRARVELGPAGPLVLEAPPEHRGTLDELAARIEPVWPRLQESLGVRPEGEIVMVLIPPGPIVDPEIARLDRAAPPWAAGFALNERRVGAVRLAKAARYPFGDATGVLVHEITHVLLHEGAGQAGGEVPRWFSEGVATREQRRWSLKDALVYSSSLLVGPLPSLAQMDRAFVTSEAAARTAYAASFDFVNWSVDRYGEDLVRRTLDGLSEGRSFRAAWRTATGVPLSESEDAWRDTALTWYRWIPALTGAGTLWTAITLLFLVASWRRRVKTQRTLERMEEEDARLAPAPTSGVPRAPRPPREEDRRRDGQGNWIN